MMIDRLSYGVGLDFSQLDRDAARADKLLGGIGKGATSEIATPKGAAAPDVGNLADRLSSSMKGGGIGAAFAPMFATLAKEIDRVGGATITMFRRMDAAMKFPSLNAAVGGVGNALLGVGVNSVRAMGMLASGAVQATAAAFRLNGALGVVVAAGATVGTVVAGRLLAIVGASSAAAGAVVKLGQGVLRASNYFSSLGDVARKTFTQIFHLGTLGVFKKMSADAAAARGVVGGLGGSIRSVGRDLLVAFGAVGLVYKFVEFLKGGITAASKLNETVNASKVIFESSYGVVKAQADEMNKLYGISKQAQLDVASGYGAMAQSAKFTTAESAKLANEMTALAANLSSSRDLPFAEAAEKIKSALAGQSEPLIKYGVLIDEDAVKAYALSHGLATSAKSIDAHAKMSARAAIIAQGLSYAQGDLANTADSAANQFRKAGGGMATFAEMIGTLLLPAVNLGTTAFNDLLAMTIETFETNLPMIESWAGYITGAMSEVGKWARNLGAYWKISQLMAGEFVANTVNWLNTLPENIGPIVLWIQNNWANMLRDLMDGTAAAFTNLLTNASNFGQALWAALSGDTDAMANFSWTPLLKGFTAATEALPEMIKPALISVQDEIDAVWAGIESKEAIRAAKLAKAVARPKDKGPADEAKKDVERKLAAAVEIGSKESYSIIQGNRVGNRDGGIKSVAANTKDNAATAREHLAWVKNHPNGFNLNPVGIN